MTDLAVDVAVHASWLLLLVFVVLYAIRSRWRRTVVGRWIMTLNGCLLLVITLAVIGRHWPGWVARPWIRVGAWWLLAAVFARQLWILLAEQAYARRGRVSNRFPALGDADSVDDA